MAPLTMAPLAILALLASTQAQTNFGGASAGSPGSQVKPSSDTRFFTGNSGLDGGLVGLGLGALGATVLAPAVGGALNSGNSGSYSSCGRRKREAADGETRFFLPSGGSCSCGRRRRQAPGEDGVNTKFFNIFGGGNSNCGSCCYNNGNYNNGNYNNGNNGFSSGFSSGRCSCNNNLTFRDQYGNTHGACRRTDTSGRTWCYTTGWSNTGCGDLQTSKRYTSNPWSYRACTYSG